MIKLNNVSVKIQKKIVLKDINLSISPGEIVGIVAPNGMGKTTLLKTITNSIIPCDGDITIFGQEYNNNRENILKRMFFLQDDNILYKEFSGKDHLLLIKKLWNSPVNASEIIKNLHMENYINKKVAKYSLGMKQRLLFAMCLASSSDILLMDEPMNGLDPSTIQMISNYIFKLKKQNKIILFSSHILQNIDYLCDRVIYLKDGKIVLDLKNNANGAQNKYVNLHLENLADINKALNFINKEKIKDIVNKKIEAELNANETEQFLYKLLENHVNFIDLKIGFKGSLQVYQELFEKRDN